MHTLLILFGPAIFVGLFTGGIVAWDAAPGGVWGSGLPAIATGLFFTFVTFIITAIVYGIRTAF